MAKITYTDKVGLVSQPVPNENKVTAENLNEIKTSVNQNVDDIALKAVINGSELETFKVANAVLSTQAVSKSQFDTAINALSGSLVPQGSWNASTNTPNISSTTETGYYWIVSVDGATDVGGITDWKVNDWVVKTSVGWAKIDNTDKITQIIAGAGLTGGGTEGALTLNAIGGDGITVNADDIQVDATVVRTSGDQSNIAGLKTFTNNLTVTGDISATDGLFSGSFQVITNQGAGSNPNASKVGAQIDTRTNTDLGGLQILTGDTNGDEPALLLTNYLDAEVFRINGTNGNLISQSGAVFSGSVSATDGTFSGSVSATDGTFSGVVSIPEYIRHISDSDTYFGFPSANNFNITTGGIETFSINSVGATFSSNVVATGFVQADNFKVNTLNTAPASATSAGTTGEIKFSSDYVYLCTSANTWKRAALTTW